MKKRKRRGLLIPFAGMENERLGREFLDNPDTFLKVHGLDWEQLACPKEAHEALSRGNAFAAEVESAGLESTPASVGKLKKIAAKHFGKAFDVALVPFGLKF